MKDKVNDNMKVHKYWNFNIDQGGTFTDIIGIAPDKN